MKQSFLPRIGAAAVAFALAFASGAVLARDVQEATRILTEHILRTLEAVRQIQPDVLS